METVTTPPDVVTHCHCRRRGQSRCVVSRRLLHLRRASPPEADGPPPSSCRTGDVPATRCFAVFFCCSSSQSRGPMPRTRLFLRRTRDSPASSAARTSPSGSHTDARLSLSHPLSVLCLFASLSRLSRLCSLPVSSTAPDPSSLPSPSLFLCAHRPLLPSFTSSPHQTPSLAAPAYRRVFSRFPFSPPFTPCSLLSFFLSAFPRLARLCRAFSPFFFVSSPPRLPTVAFSSLSPVAGACRTCIPTAWLSFRLCFRTAPNPLSCHHGHPHRWWSCRRNRRVRSVARLSAGLSFLSLFFFTPPLSLSLSCLARREPPGRCLRSGVAEPRLQRWPRFLGRDRVPATSSSPPSSHRCSVASHGFLLCCSSVCTPETRALPTPTFLARPTFPSSSLAPSALESLTCYLFELHSHLRRASARVRPFSYPLVTFAARFAGMARLPAVFVV